MKTAQNRADEGASKCENLEKALQEKVRAYVGSPELHEKAITDLPEEADRMGTPVRDGVARAREVDSSMNDWLGRVKNFSQSEGPWAAVTSNLRDSADRVSSYWKDKFGAMTRACERLVLGRDHPDVKRAVDEMSRDTKAAGETYRELRDEFIRWKAEVDQLRAWSDEDVEGIRQEFCNAPDADELTKVTEVANRWASQINGLYGSINGSGDRIKRAADDLIAKKGALKAAPKVKDAVDKILVSIAKLKDYQLLGSNNPLFKAQADYGVTKHADMQRSCEASEIRISGDYCDNPKPNRTDCRLDCVKRCDIVEISREGLVRWASSRRTPT
ncbi:MAG: hypothetical protein K8W52_27685 [Deltaproteobacteria bacterium]|nr:hypothetical protein [Deltaproteobacteria bacterium]